MLGTLAWILPLQAVIFDKGSGPLSRAVAVAGASSDLQPDRRGGGARRRADPGRHGHAHAAPT